MDIRAYPLFFFQLYKVTQWAYVLHLHVHHHDHVQTIE